MTPIPVEIITGISAMLQPYNPDLTPTELTERLTADNQQETILSRDQAAAYLRVSTTTLWRYTQAGKIKAIKRGPARKDKIEYYKTDLDKFRKDHIK